jgi:hypothetical protein
MKLLLVLSLLVAVAAGAMCSDQATPPTIITPLDCGAKVLAGDLACCEKETCRQFSCQMQVPPKMWKSNYASIVCPAGATGCDSALCCDDIPVVTPTGCALTPAMCFMEVNKTNKVDFYTNPGTTVADCCRDNNLCRDHICTGGKTWIEANYDNVGNTDAACCEDIHPCYLRACANPTGSRGTAYPTLTPASVTTTAEATDALCGCKTTCNDIFCQQTGLYSMDPMSMDMMSMVNCAGVTCETPETCCVDPPAPPAPAPSTDGSASVVASVAVVLAALAITF